MDSIIGTWRENVTQLKDVLKKLLPQNKSEFILLICLLVFFGSFGFVVSHDTSLQDFFKKKDGLYFGFDSGYFFHRGIASQNIIHPLVKFVGIPIINTLNGLAVILQDHKIKTYILGLFCNLLISMSIVYLYRYLREIVMLRGYILYVLIIMYSSFFTNLVLSFTTESYTVTIFLLTFIIYYSSLCIYNQKNITFSFVLLSSIALGGITVTNFIKGLIPQFYTKDKISFSLKRISLICTLLISTSIILIFINRVDIMQDIYIRLEYTDNLGSEISYLKYLVSFFGMPILFSDLYVNYVEDEGLDHLFAMIEVSLLNQVWQYIIIFSILCSMLFSLIYNRKNKLVLLLLSMFSIDLLIHLVFKHGMSEPWMYGGHWVYIVPLLLGWLYKSLNGKVSKVYIVLISIISIVLVTNNLFQLMQFLDLGKALYPAELGVWEFK